MNKIKDLKPQKVFEYFEEISAVPRGSGNMKPIADYCEEFAKKHSLEVIRDKMDNIIIFKDATKGYENAEPVILQGHLDMVCQKDDGVLTNFERDGIELIVDGDYIKAKGTTLGADNGIALAMIMAILTDDTLSHPPIEALFTTDEETGMYGATAIDGALFKGKKLINLDSEEQDKLTVSCAGGSEFELDIPFERKNVTGEKITLTVSGLKGGHSGIEIDKGRINASFLMGRILGVVEEFEVVSITGGDKSNAITNSCTAQIVVSDAKKTVEILKNTAVEIKTEIADMESDFNLLVTEGGKGEFETMSGEAKDKLIFALMFMPNGVQSMSASIEGLVETSLNMGILKTEKDRVVMVSALRSNKQSALCYLEDKLKIFAKTLKCEYETSGHYPPWEYKENSALRKQYIECFEEKFGYKPTVEAIHAGLECGVLASKIDDLDAISIGPELSDVHTTKEKLKISSAKEIYELVCSLLEKMK